MKPFNLALLSVNSKDIIYEVSMEDSPLAKGLFKIERDSFENNIFESNHFIKQLNRAVYDLQQYNPDYHQELIKNIYGE